MNGIAPSPTAHSDNAPALPASRHVPATDPHRPAGTRGMTARQVRVWDLVVRFGHWMLVACFFTAWLTEGSPMWLHKSAGYGVAIVLGFRLLWGFIGTRHARFADFLYPPREAIAYLKGLVAGRPRHYLGHNPAGGLMVVALLLALAGTASTGMALYDANSGKGPVAAVRVWLSEAPPAPGARHKRDKKAAHFWEDLHEFFANATMLLVALHIGGVVVSSLAHDENLVRAMITGRKKVP